MYRQQRATAVGAARERFWDDLRATAALEQVSSWETAQRLRAFAAAMRGRDVQGDDGWLDWIVAHADRLDPPDQVLQAPPLPESPTEWSELAPYLKRWPDSRPPWWSPPSDPASS